MGKTKFSRKNGKVIVHGHKYDKLEGTRAMVWHKTAFKTSGDLKRNNLIKNKHGRIVSKKLHDRAKREKRLEKAGYKTKKGHFGSYHESDKKRKHSRSKKMRKGSRKHKHRGGMMSSLTPSSYDGKGEGTSGAGIQLMATNY
jgi:hypothetical protein